MELGVCYYPEHWPESTWKPDAERMKDLGIRWVRVGEFAWSRLEPEDGKLDFAWLDRIIDILGKSGLKVVLGTPTATPPKWLLDKYNDIYQRDVQGRKRGFGSRRHYCFSSPSYQEETRRIVTLLSERYGKHEAVGAWQTDNEYGCHDTVRCYCQNCRQAFRDWLKYNYADINALNEAWWNVFWSMDYLSFAEIELPNLTVAEANPSHMLDYYRFASDALIAYNQLQTKIIREHSPGRLITHNAMIYFGDFDHFELARDLDVISWDNYPLGMLEHSPLPETTKEQFLRSGHPDLISFNHDLYRGVKRRPFWVMEQQPGQVNWAPSNPLPAPGVVRLWSQQAFAHGANVVSYFRWRAARGAQELMHAGLNLHDGSPDRASAEAKRVFEEIPEESAGQITAPVALLFDYENLWATDLQKHAQAWSYWGIQVSWYMVLRSFGLDVDIIHPREDLSGYKAVFAPALHLVDDLLAEHLSDYVRAGGQLVIGPRSGAKTLTNIAQAPAPGPLADLMGLRIDHVDALRPGFEEEVEFQGSLYAYTTWADLLTPTKAEVLANYQSPAYVGAAAITRRALGTGHCTTVGMWGSPELNAVIFSSILRTAAVPLLHLPDGLRLSRRGNIDYLLNFNQEPITLDGGLEQAGEVIGPHEVILLRR